MLAQLAMAASVTAAAEAAAPKPHIVYILSDNLCPFPAPTPLTLPTLSWLNRRRVLHSGWGNVGYHRKHSSPSPEVVTPRLDELVATGIELDRL